MLEPNKYQKDIYDKIKNGKENIMVEAVAGSGKTTTLLEALHLLPETARTIFTAFNKSIAEEIKSRINLGIDVKTMNSIGYATFFRNGYKPQVNPKKSYDIWNSIQKDEEFDHQDMNFFIRKEMAYSVVRLVDIAKNSGMYTEDCMNYMLEDTDENWKNLMTTYGLNFDNALDKAQDLGFLMEEDENCDVPEEWDEETEETATKMINDLGISYAREILELGFKDTVFVDFTDQLYLPVMMNMSFTKYDYIFIDEVQDLNVIQQELLTRMTKASGKIIAVGDRNQSIYGFRGADTFAMDNLKKKFNCTELPLSISYRCAKNIVQHARKFVTHIESKDNAPMGVVTDKGEYNTCTFKPEDMVICRVNASLIKFAFHLIQRGITFRYLGKDFAERLMTLVDKISKKNSSMSYIEFNDKLNNWYIKRRAKLVKKDKPVGNLDDDYYSIMAVLKNSTIKNAGDINAKLRYLFMGNPKDSVTLTTIHKAKGLEANTVYILDDYFGEYFESRCSQEWIKQQERNMKYVAITRAKLNLFYITTPKDKK